MKNAKEELLDVLSKLKLDIKCAEIFYDIKYFNLKIGHSYKEYNQFLEDLNFEYDNGYGEQELFGIIWFEDGSWLSRKEYDGDEYWRYNKTPDIPEILKS